MTTIHKAPLSMIAMLKKEGPDILRTSYRGLPRLQPYPGPTDKAGPHVEGRALDIVLLGEREAECSIADSLIECFLNQRDFIEWELMIYNGEQWDSTGAKTPRIWNPREHQDKKAPGRDWEHRTHIHIQWSKHKAQLDYAEEISTALAALN